MKKRILSLVLALSMMISLFPVSALAQTHGGGTAEMAEENGEDIDAANGADVTTIQIDGNGEPVGDDGANGKNWEYDSNLTLKKGTYTFSAPVTCGVIINNGATVVGGTFEGTVWNEAGGKISGGTFADVSNRGTIIGGTFTGAHGSVINHTTIAGGVFEKNVTNGDSGDEGISASITGGLFKAEVQNNAASAAITGGVFVTIPTGSGTIANGYTLTTKGATSKFLYAADGKEIDLGQSVYVIPNDTDALKVVGDGVSNWDVVDGSGTHALATWNGVTLKQDGSFTLNPDKISGTTLTFTVSTTPVTPDPELVLAGGVPDTSEQHAKQKTVYYGNGWEYDGKTLTLTSGEWNFLNDPEIRCNVDINQDAVLKDGTINATVKNYGTIEGGTIRFCDNYGTIVNGTFDNPNKLYCIWNYNLISDGVFEQGIQACVGDGMASKITGGTFKSGFYTSGSGEGTTVTGGTFASPPTNATGKMYSVSIGSWSGKCSIAINGVDFGENKSVYVVGQDYKDVKITATAFDTYVDANTNTTKKFKEWQISPTSATLNAVDGGTVDLTQKEIKFFMPDSYKNITLAAKYETVSTPTFDENLEIGADGKPVTENRKPYGNSGVQGDGWTYDGTTLTLSGSSWSFSKYPAVTCPVALGYNTGLIGGTFEKAVTGGTSSYVNRGIFLSTVNVAKIDSGIFKTAPNGTTCCTVKAGDSNKLGVKVNGAEFVDFGTDEAQVVGNFEFSVQLRNANGDVVEITNINGKEIGSAYGSHYMNGGPAVEFTMPSENVVLNQESTTKTYTLTLTDATADPAKTKYNDGDEITLTAEDAADGKEFDKWVLHGLTLVDGCKETNATIEVTITGNATAKATYKDKAPTTYTLTVDGGYIGDDETKASGKFKSKEQVEVTAKAKTGYHFTKWTVEEGTLSLSEEKLKANPLTFGMPDGAVSLKANYEKDTPDPVDPNPTPNPDAQPTTYTITTDIYGEVNGGASATVKENDWVHMTVAEVPEGMTFDYWNIPDALLKALQKQNSGFRNNVESLSFQMPDMGEEEQTFAIKANFRSSELPGEDDGPSTLGTMATVAVGGAAAGILVWQGVSLGVDSYLQLNLPKGVAVPANRRELVMLLWETAGKPEAALPSLYSDVPAEEIELQKATRWAIDNGLVKPADDSDASRFDPDRYVTKYDVFGAWLKLKKLMK